MRVFSIITAIIVMAALYLLVFERQNIIAFATGGTEASESEMAPKTTTAPVEAEAEDVAEGAVSVVALKSKATQVDNAVLVRGRTEAARQVDVRAETTGLVISNPLRKGASVEAGQLMCVLDPGTREISLQEAQARLQEAKARLPESQARLGEANARLKEAEINETAAARLGEDGFASTTRVAQAQAAAEAARAGIESAKSGVESAAAGVQAAEAGVAAAEKEIDRLDVRAPFAGLLESDTAEIGSLLQPGALCATVIQLNPIKLVGFVPETEVDRVTPGSNAIARLASGREIIGKVTFISRSADQNTRTFQIEVQVDNSDLSIRDGQTVEIAIASEGNTAHLVPQSALTLNNDGLLGVRLVDAGNLASFAPVSVIRDTTDGIWVSGLDPDVAVIVVGQEFVTDGVPVAPTFKEASQ